VEQRDDEVVAGAGGGDVEKAQPLVLVHLLLDRMGERELLGLPDPT